MLLHCQTSSGVHFSVGVGILGDSDWTVISLGASAVGPAGATGRSFEGSGVPMFVSGRRGIEGSGDRAKVDDGASVDVDSPSSLGG